MSKIDLKHTLVFLTAPPSGCIGKETRIQAMAQNLKKNNLTSLQ